MSDADLSADEAAALLGITKQTLYAYVSRGLVQSAPGPGPSRARVYPRGPVEALRRGRTVTAPQKGAAAAMQWGLPVLESSLSLIEDGRLSYRSHDAADLAANGTLEDVAALLWEAPDPIVFPAGRPRTRADATDDPIAVLMRILAHDSVPTLAGSHTPHPVNVKHAARLVARAFAAVGGAGDGPLAQRLAGAFASDRGDVISAALVLCADHELNVSAFTARCVASADSGLEDAVLAALCAFRGHRHGGAGRQLVQVIADARTTDPRQAVRRALGAFGEVPGFGHPLYPAGDPRAALLLQLVDWRDDPLLDALVEICADELDARPNLDFALLTVATNLGLPDSAGTTMFALGRFVGWIAHVFETWSSGSLIRPRARYVGPRPDLQSSP